MIVSEELFDDSYHKFQETTTPWDETSWELPLVPVVSEPVIDGGIQLEDFNLSRITSKNLSNVRLDNSTHDPKGEETWSNRARGMTARPLLVMRGK